MGSGKITKVEKMLGIHVKEPPQRRRKRLPKLALSQLEKLSTQRLLQVLKAARACYSAVNKARRCDCCGQLYSEIYPEHKFYGDYEKDVRELRDYYRTIKSILSERPNLEKRAK